MLAKIVTATLITLSSFTAQASTGQQECDGSTAEMLECIGAQYSVADKELNASYQALRTQLKFLITSGDAISKKDAAEVDKRLVASQLAWIAFRDADCQLQGVDMLGGSGEGLVIGGCLLAKTQERIKALKEYSF